MNSTWRISTIQKKSRPDEGKITQSYKIENRKNKERFHGLSFQTFENMPDSSFLENYETLALI